MLSIMLLVILSVMSTAVLLNIMKEKETYIDSYSNTTLMQIATTGLNEVLYRMNKYPDDSLYIGNFYDSHSIYWQTVILFNNVNYKKENTYYKKSILMGINNFDKNIEFNYTTKNYIKNKSLTITYKIFNDSIYFYNNQKNIIELLPISYLSIFSPIYRVNIFAKNKMFAKKFIAEIYNEGKNFILGTIVCQSIYCVENGKIDISGYDHFPDIEYSSNIQSNKLKKIYLNEEYNRIPSIASIFYIENNDFDINFDTDNTKISNIPSFSNLFEREINTLNFKNYETGIIDTVNYSYFYINNTNIELNFDSYTKGFIYSHGDLVLDGNFTFSHKGLVYINGNLIIKDNAKLWILGSLIVNGKIICNGEINVLYSSPYTNTYHFINNYKLYKWE